MSSHKKYLPNQIAMGLVTLLIFCGLETQAAMFGASCVTQPPSTSMLLQPGAEKMTLTIVHHHGTEYMPIHHTSTTPHDLPLLAKRADALKKLGPRYQFTFPMKECEKSARGMFQCKFGDPTSINGIEVQPWTVYSSTISHRSMVTDYEVTQVEVMFKMDGQTYSYAMQYSPGECLIN